MGSTFDGSYEDAKKTSELLDDLQKRTGLDIPLHVDGASGGFEGYKREQGYARKVAMYTSAAIAKMGPFELLTEGDALPVFAFKLRDDVENFTVFDVSAALRERGWQVPAYTFPKNTEDLAVLRVVVRRGFTMDVPTCWSRTSERRSGFSRS